MKTVSQTWIIAAPPITNAMNTEGRLIPVAAQRPASAAAAQHLTGRRRLQADVSPPGREEVCIDHLSCIRQMYGYNVGTRG
jgi:hypothetical protein